MVLVKNCVNKSIFNESTMNNQKLDDIANCSSFILNGFGATDI